MTLQNQSWHSFYQSLPSTSSYNQRVSTRPQPPQRDDHHKLTSSPTPEPVRLGIDSLHIGLIQVVLILLFRFILNFDPRNAFGSRNKSVVSAKNEDHGVSTSTGIETTTTALTKSKGGATLRKRRTRKSKKKSSNSNENSLFPPPLLDATMYKFLSITEPSYAKLLPTPDPSLTENAPPSAALSTWTSLYSSENIQVLQHPKLKMLYAIAATFPDVGVRQLFETLANVDERPGWDGMCSGSENVERVEVGGRKGNVVWMGMKGMYPVKAKDLVLLSMAALLPSSPNKESSSEKSSSEKPSSENDQTPSPIRVICATTSFKHPKVPEKKEFNRMELTISGFLCEEVGKGSKVVQITDLSGLGSWVPSAIIRTVTQTMIPKSLAKLGKAAAAYDIATKSEHPVEGTAWLPPLLGTFDDKVAEGADNEGEEEEELEGDEEEFDDESDFEGDEEDDQLRSNGDLRSLLAQLRSLTSRLSALESASTSSTTTTGSRPWYSFLTSSSSSGVEQGQLTVGAKVGFVGGAVGAAAALALLQVWSRRRR